MRHLRRTTSGVHRIGGGPAAGFRRPAARYVARVDTDAVLTMLKEVAEEVVNPRFRALAKAEISEKNPGDLVTIADREAEVRITKVLRDAYPNALVLGEEATATDPALLDRFRSADHAFT